MFCDVELHQLLTTTLLKTAMDGEQNMTHDLVNIFFKLLLKNLISILHFGTNYSHRIVHMNFFYK